MKVRLILLLVVLAALPLLAATRQYALEHLHPTWPAEDPAARMQAFETRQALLAESPYSVIPFRVVGPMAQGGRVMALAMDERQPTTWLAAYATGGVWITHTDGRTWESLFDNEAAFGIGEMAVSWGEPGVPATIWVGTGEASNTRTVYMGAGLYRSRDQGKTWQNVGLNNSHHIGRIAIHPSNPDVVFVAALGPVYTEGGDRGIFRTTDGGETWVNVLPCPEFTGAIDVLIDWDNPDIVYACTWERHRKAWDFRESGPGTGVWKSTDGGRTFARQESGLPVGDGMGRIGLAQSRQNPQKLYAFVDNQTPRPYSDEYPEPLSGKAFLDMTQEEFVALTDEKIDQFLRLYSFPRRFSAENIRKDLEEGKVTFEEMRTHVKPQAEIPIFFPKCIGPELYVTLDGGATWTKTHTVDFWQDMDWGYGTATYYFGRVAVDSADDRKVLICAIRLIKTEDGGQTFQYADEYGYDVHADHHAIVYHSTNSRRVLLGNDGGLNVSLDAGQTWTPVKNMPVAQCYTVTYDFAEPYRIYSGLQDNGIWTGTAREIEPYQQVDSWEQIWGADGMFIQVNPKDNNTIYLGTQFGAMSRLNFHTRESQRIRPQPEFPKEEPFRTNWVTPIEMSSFHPDIVYTGTQFVHRSFDRGDTWTIISPDLTSEGQADSFVNAGGNVSYGNLSALAESPLRFGLLYAGTDEGWLWVTRDGGANWTRCTEGIPQNKWVTRVEPSHFDEGTVYATFTGFRENDATAYVYKSTDFGATWTSIQGNLPDECLNVVREDPVNPELLYVGSDFGVYVSLDGGKRWDVLGDQIPNVPAYDLCIHPRDKEIIIGTYGRSVWVGPVDVLQAYTAEIRGQALHLFGVKKQQAHEWWEKEKPVQIGKPREVDPLFIFYHAQAGPAVARLENDKGEVYRTWALDAKAGLNRFEWDYMVDPAKRGELPAGRRPFVEPGEYVLLLEQAGESAQTPVTVEKPKKRERGRFDDEGGK
ncbi:MAG: glycosyl hydrolase [Acidobacteria bacterium]|nr:glycosyl hydrolase [Acidobacteriota bacterium]